MQQLRAGLKVTQQEMGARSGEKVNKAYSCESAAIAPSWTGLLTACKICQTRQMKRQTRQGACILSPL